MILNNLLTSGKNFDNDSSRTKFRFTMVNGIFIAGIVIAFLAAILRFHAHNYTIATIDISLAVIFTGALVHLRFRHDSIDLVANILLSVSFLAFTALMIQNEDEKIKLLWYTLLISVTFMVKGIRAGLVVYGAVITALTLLYVVPQIEPALQEHISLHLSSTALIVTMLFYSITTLYALFDTLEQEKSLESLETANRDIEHQKETIQKQMRTNALTGLPNTLALQERVSARQGHKMALVTMVIDDFVMLANEYGRKNGDKIVQRCAALLQRFAKQQNLTLYHVAPYQYSFLIENGTNASACALAESIRSYFFHTSVDIDDHLQVSLSFSGGIAMGEDLELITHADSAMQQALQQGTNNFLTFQNDPKREEEQKNNIYWNSKIKEIIINDKLKLFYQPIFDNNTGEIVKYEALIRAMDGDRVISPYQFLQAARTRGLLPEITKFVIRESFQRFSKEQIDLTINISAEDLRANYLHAYLDRYTTKYQIAPERVYLEVLENLTTEQSHETATQFARLKKMGFRIAIDDFGAESSNFSRLLTYDADIIKIDGQFIKHLDTDPNSLKIVEAIVSLSHRLGIKTVAEFVHNEKIYEIVKTLGVDFSQGFFLGEPGPELVHTSEKQLDKELIAD